MMGRSFNIGDAIRYGWEIVKNNIAFFIIMLLIVYGLSITISFVARHVGMLGIIVTLAGLVVQFLMAIGMVKIVLGFIDNRKPALGELFDGLPLVINYFIANIIFVVVCAMGFICLIVPGIYLMCRLIFWQFFVVDRNLGPVEALQASWEATRGIALNVFLFGMVLWLLNLVGLICLGVGLLVTIPISMVAVAYVYRTLLAQMAQDGSLESA